MAGVAVKVLTGQVLARLQGLEERGENLSGLMRSFGEYMKGSIQKNFDAQGRPVKWAPISFGTKVAWHTKRRSYWTKKDKMSKKGKAAWSGRLVLTDTGRLRRSIYATAGGDSLTLGTNVIYAALHQFGGQAGRGKKIFIPARPYLLFQPEDLERFHKMLVNYLLAGRLV
jgi:phage virion morphogenesis protein